MLCPPPPTLNPVTIFEAARLPHRANSSRAAGSFFGPEAEGRGLLSVPTYGFTAQLDPCHLILLRPWDV